MRVNCPRCGAKLDLLDQNYFLHIVESLIVCRHNFCLDHASIAIRGVEVNQIVVRSERNDFNYKNGVRRRKDSQMDLARS